MSYITILDYTTGTTIIDVDPDFENSDDYENWIKENHGVNMNNGYYMVGNSLNIQL